MKDAQGNPWLTTHLKPVLASALTPEELAGFRAAEQRLDEDLNGEVPPVITAADIPEKLRSLQAGFDRFGIRRHPDGRITGRPIFFGIHSRFYQQVENGQNIARSFVTSRVLLYFIFGLNVSSQAFLASNFFFIHIINAAYLTSNSSSSNLT